MCRCVGLSTAIYARASFLNPAYIHTHGLPTFRFCSRVHGLRAGLDGQSEDSSVPVRAGLHLELRFMSDALKGVDNKMQLRVPSTETWTM